MQFDKGFNPILPNIITLTQGDYREESQTDNLMVRVVCKPNLVHSAPASALSAAGDSSAQKRPTSLLTYNIWSVTPLYTLLALTLNQSLHL